MASINLGLARMAAYSSSYSLCCAHLATKPVLFARVSQNTRPESILMSRGAPAASSKETLPFVTGASRSASHSSRSKTRTRVEGGGAVRNRRFSSAIFSASASSSSSLSESKTDSWPRSAAFLMARACAGRVAKLPRLAQNTLS